MMRTVPLLLALALLSCGAPPAGEDARGTPGEGEGALGAAPSARAGCRKAWTVLIYMAADNEDLPPYAYGHLTDMEAAFADPNESAASTKDADVIVQVDLLDPPGIRRLHLSLGPEPYTPRRCRELTGCSLSDIASPVVAYDVNESLSPGESLRRFLAWGVSSYPSRHYLVVVWGHGLGWLPALRSGEAEPESWHRLGGIAWDQSQRTVLDTPSLRAALEAVSREHLGGRPFDIYASDACLMQSLEVATELADVARYIVGSEQIEDYVGLPYRTLIPRLNGTAKAPPPAPGCAADDQACAVAALLPALDREAWSPGGLYAGELTAGQESFTLSTLDAAALSVELLPAVSALAVALDGYLREDELRRLDLQILLRESSSPAAPLATGIPGFWGGARDVGVFLEHLRAAVEGAPSSDAVSRLLDAIDDTRAALGRTVVAAAFGARYADIAGMAGVSVWLPRDASEFFQRVDFFASSRLYARVPAFHAFLLRLFAGSE